MTVLLAVLALVPAQPKPDPKDRPVLIVAEPLGVPAGQPVRLKLRGLKLDGVTEVRCHEPKSLVKLTGRPEKVGVPDPKLLQQLGDTRIEIELKVPSELAGGEVSVSVVGPAGESLPLRILLNDESPRIVEKEPNDGFRTAQPVPVPCLIDGSVRQNQDVDVFRIDGKAGRSLTLTLIGPRYGSPIDPLVTVYDDRGRVISASDEAPRNENVRLNVVLPRDGVYFIAVVDANDLGSAVHAYRLRLD